MIIHPVLPIMSKRCHEISGKTWAFVLSYRVFYFIVKILAYLFWFVILLYIQNIVNARVFLNILCHTNIVYHCMFNRAYIGEVCLGMC